MYIIAILKNNVIAKLLRFAIYTLGVGENS